MPSLKILAATAVLLANIELALGQGALYSQCEWSNEVFMMTMLIFLGGGIGWKGATTCASGSVCKYSK